MSIRKITVVGLKKKDRVVLKAAIETASGFETGPWEFTEDQSAAQAIILNPSDQQSNKIIESYDGDDEAPLFVGYTKSKVAGQQVFRFMIDPPLTYMTVLATLRQIDLVVKNPEDDEDSQVVKDGHNRKEQNKLTSKATTKGNTSGQPVAEVSEVIPAIDAKMSEDQKLYHIIREVIAENLSVEISHPKFPSIKICAEKHWFIFSGDLGKQTDLFRTNVNEFTIEEKGDEIRKQACSGSFPKALWGLIYTSTLIGTEGELLEPLLPEDQLHLIELPEFEKAPHSEQHIAIADYMVSHSATVEAVANNLDIDLPIVIDFCNACHSIGLLIATGQPQNKLFRLINRIIEQKKSVEITHPDFPGIAICSEKDWFIFPEDLNKHTDMFCIDAGEFIFENKGDEIRKQAFGRSFPKSLWELVYTATMFGTEGKLISPLQASDKLNLIKMPEFEYVIHTDEHIALARYMTTYSDTVHNIASNTSTELKNVIDFSNICQAINLVERNNNTLSSYSESEGDTTIESKIEDVKARQSEEQATVSTTTLFGALFSNPNK